MGDLEHRRRKSTRVALAALLVGIAACGSGEVPTKHGEDLGTTPPIARVSAPCPPGFTASQCADIEAAIAILASHSGWNCQLAAEMMAGRMGNGTVSMIDEPGTYGKVYRYSNGEWSPWVSLGEEIWEYYDPVDALVNTIAHEMYGHIAANGNEDTAYFWGDYCSGWL